MVQFVRGDEVVGNMDIDPTQVKKVILRGRSGTVELPLFVDENVIKLEFMARPQDELELLEYLHRHFDVVDQPNVGLAENEENKRLEFAEQTENAYKEDAVFDDGVETPLEKTLTGDPDFGVQDVNTDKDSTEHQHDLSRPNVADPEELDKTSDANFPTTLDVDPAEPGEAEDDQEDEKSENQEISEKIPPASFALDDPPGEVRSEAADPHPASDTKD